VEVDSCLEITFVAEASRGVLHPWSLRVRTFAQRVGDRVGKVGQDILQVAVEHLGFLNHWLQATVDGPTIPPMEMSFRDASVGAIRQFHRLISHRPCPRRLQVAAAKAAQCAPVFLAEFVTSLQSVVLGSHQRIVFTLAQLFVFGPTHFVHRFAKMFGNVELVYHTQSELASPSLPTSVPTPFTAHTN
jgi:hypothetical protein